MSKEYVVVLYEKCHKKTTKLTGPLTETEALDFWKKKTDNGRKHSRPGHGDYFKIIEIDDGFIVSNYKA